ncbi:MAG: DUF4340 domain-containing protein, partial [bacterium]|nr:DUF4340 domain-containing protein [bacterium]
MKFRTTLILLVVAAGIACFILFYERGRMPTDERLEKGKLVFSVRADDIDRLRISRGPEEIVCERGADGEWRIERPIAARADKAQLRSIAGRLESLAAERVIAAGEVDEGALEEFGLKEPALAARFRAAGREFGLLIGADAPLGDNLYARVEGEGDVRLLGRGIRSVLDRPLPDLRDRTVLEFEIPDVDRLEIARDG